MLRLMASKVRLYLKHPLHETQAIPLSRDQAHYLFGVMRLGVGDVLTVFNGEDGAWQSEVAVASKRGGVLTCLMQMSPLRLPPDLWLLFAPIKKARTDFIVEKATEMGVRRICPIQTEFTNAERIRQDRLQAHAIEAAEQCGGTFVPEVTQLQRLDDLLDRWPSERGLMFCDEAAAGAGTGNHLTDAKSGPWAVVIGPEGGFSEHERIKLLNMDQSVRICLGPRILRADTAAVAALTVWQMALGDW
jgi:16S rRNA (uracil1498-N3)-methyltransferase